MSRTEPPIIVTRRTALQLLGVGLAAAPLLACKSDRVSAQPGASAGSDAESGSDAASDASSSLDGGATAWATGGTAAMLAAASYPDPFASGLGATCALYCASTLGPCYAETVERKDISEGQPGLPTRIALLVVDATCKPISGATVDIWHCSPSGLYSGDDASDFCTDADATARAARWFRGVQTSDAAGRVSFDTCFPGWYSSRTIHVHFTVRVNGSELVTSQLVFADTLDNEIVATQDLYSTRGARDTLNTNDNVVGGEDDLSSYTFQTARMSDGALLAWKTLVIRTASADALCTIAGAGGAMAGVPGGMGGPPPDR